MKNVVGLQPTQPVHSYAKEQKWAGLTMTCFNPSNSSRIPAYIDTPKEDAEIIQKFIGRFLPSNKKEPVNNKPTVTQSPQPQKQSPTRCNQWVAGNGVPAYLCNDCGWGSAAENCCVCGEWAASNGVKAQLCNNCGWGSDAENCCKCSNWCGGTYYIYIYSIDCTFYCF